MLIDVIKHKKQRIDNGEWFVPLSDYKWIAAQEGNNETIFEFIEPITIKNIDISYTANQSPYINISYSYDGQLFYELEYISYTIVDDSLISPSIKESIIRYENRLIKSKTIYINDSISSVYIIYKENGIDIEEIDNVELLLLKNFLDINRNQKTIIDVKYVYEFVNGYNNVSRILYSNKIKFIKLSVTDLTLPFSLDKFEVYSEEYINDIEQNITLISDNFFQAKYFYEYPFISSISKTFFEMLETTKVD